jgi:hypothetical protein
VREGEKTAGKERSSPRGLPRGQEGLGRTGGDGGERRSSRTAVKLDFVMWRRRAARVGAVGWKRCGG